MGNGVGGGFSLSSKAGAADNCSYQKQLGNFATINVKPREVVGLTYEGGYNELWTVTYNVELSGFVLQLTRQVGKDGDVKVLVIEGRGCPSYQYMNFRIGIRRTETGLLEMFDLSPTYAPGWRKNNTAIHERGSVTATTVLLCGKGTRGGLLVLEGKKKSRDELPFHAITVAHYLVNSSDDIFHRYKTDIGLSVVAKIRPSNRGLDVTLEGPLPHPSSALFFMFDQVYKTGVWKPTSCPHCDNILRQKLAGNSSQSDSEDSDYFSPASSPGSCNKQPGGSLLANDGAIKGNNNGNIHVNKLYLRGN